MFGRAMLTGHSQYIASRSQSRGSRGITHHILASCLILLHLLRLTAAVFINFENCLSQSTIDSEPRRLQFTPYFVDARFDGSGSTNSLNITVYGNVSGQTVEGDYPQPSDPDWLNRNVTFGKIVNVSPSGGNFTTLQQSYDFLSYTAWSAPASRFCGAAVNESCPIIPSFNGSQFDPSSLTAFTVAHDFDDSFSFASIAATLTIEAGSEGAPEIGCISANITPDLGSSVGGLLIFLPVAVLICVAIATAAAAIFSPWGSSDPYKWTTNYGRDEDLLRLVTPGFADCLQYIQFIFLTGTLSLSYPGYFQPATSQACWSALLFDESFVSGGNGTQILQDGLYATNGTYGMTRMRQLIGMQHDQDLWACMAIWLLVLGVIALLLCQVALGLRWLYYKFSNTSEEDLRRKGLPLSVGMLTRIIMNYFLLPVVALSFYQLDIASRSLTVVIVFAALLLVAVIATAGRIMWVIFATKPRGLLFDDLQTVLMYGTLYNTYSDERAPFALIPAMLAFMRGVAFGAIQPSGIAQLVVLAICEVVFLLMLHAFRPFSAKTSMNVVHTIFTAARLIIILLLVAFVPSLEVGTGPTGWIGYVILVLHALVLFIFFANAVSTIFEVVARYAGAGADAQHGAQRGGLVSYGWRQLRSRQPAMSARPGSVASNAAMMSLDPDYKSARLSRSQSASSQMMLAAGNRRTSGFGPVSQDPETPSGTSPRRSSTNEHSRRASEQGGRPSLVLRTEEATSDPYFRSPRGRRNTLDPYTPIAKNRQSGVDGWGRAAVGHSPVSPSRRDDGNDDHGGVSPADYASGSRHRSPSNTDYAVRESDLFYGGRGPALSKHPTRKRKTGPADPMGRVTTAATFFNRFFGGMGGKAKSKDEAKGFEVVRNARAPPPMKDTLSPTRFEEQEMQESPSMSFPVNYTDEPRSQAAIGKDNDSGAAAAREIRTGPRVMSGPMPFDGAWDNDSDEDSEESEAAVVLSRNLPIIRTDTPERAARSSSPPMLSPIDTSNFDVSFLQRQASQRPRPQSIDSQGDGPMIPRKSSKRRPSMEAQSASPAGGRPSSLIAQHAGLERPTSLGVVSQHTTRDSIVQAGAAQEAQESSAEFVHDNKA